MNDSCNNIINPLKLKREGTNQEERALLSLDPATAPIDHQRDADLLVFSQKLAKQIKFFQFDNQAPAGSNWTPFFQNNVSFLLATISIEDIRQFQYKVQDLLEFLREGNGTPLELQQAFGTLLSLLASLAKSLDELQYKISDELGLPLSIRSLIQAKLAESFRRLIAYHKAAVIEGLIDDSVLPTPAINILGKPIERISDLINQTFSSHWITDQSANWTTFVTSTAADDSIYNLSDPDLARRLYFASNHFFFTSIIDQFTKALSSIIQQANSQLQQTLSDWSKHEPHHALLIAFIKLFGYNRDFINTLSQRHLDLYYQQILGLKTKAASPNQVHVIFQLAKNLESELISKGTLLRAGKDEEGNLVEYALVDDLVVNKATVGEIKSLYFGTAQDETLGTMIARNLEGRAFASPVAKSIDGLGGELEEPNLSWHPIASKTYENGLLKEIRMPDARLGFGIASHYLLLREGIRTIVLELTYDNTTVISVSLINQLKGAITTEEEWMELSVNASVAATANPALNMLTLTMSMTADDMATAPYNPEVHLGQFETKHPLLTITLSQDQNNYLYEQLKNIRLTDVSLTVSANEVRNLSIHNDFGAVDPTQPFQPFGAIPKNDAFLIVGNDEIFQKAGASVSPVIQWAPPEGSMPSVTSNVRIKRAGNWNSLAKESTNIFSNNTAIGSFTVASGDAIAPTYEDNRPYTLQETKGFFRIQLNNDLGHADYQTALTDHLIAKAKGLPEDTIQQYVSLYNSGTWTANTAIYYINQAVSAGGSTTPPPVPYTPEIQEIYLNYSASTSLDITSQNDSVFENRSLQFFHLFPFGEREEHRYYYDQGLRDEGKVFLLPPFKHHNSQDPFFIIEEEDGTIEEWIHHEGEFYIEIKDAEPPAILSILFQLEEGSTNPLIKKPEQHIHWSYLSNNNWVSFEKNSVVDYTLQLTKSGRVIFSLPREATNENSLLPTGSYWLRAAIRTGNESVAKAMDVLAQAGLAIMVENDNAASVYSQPLPASTIKKLLRPVAAVKKIKQPYNSFGGKPQEDSGAFYQRVSERLRHKDRAINTWDYEHLILDAFPQLHKVKCIPHTRYEPSDSGGIYNELAAGHVTIICIPDLKGATGNNPLKPYTSVSDLLSIEAFLKKRNSCFAKLHVRNPLFEEIKVYCHVHFHPQYDETYFTNFLKQEITQFLSPWAFETTSEISFGGSIESSDLINFIEERYYIDYLTDFKLLYRADQSLAFQEMQRVEVEKAISILVSVPWEQHIIQVIPEGEENEIQEKCICPPTTALTNTNQ